MGDRFEVPVRLFGRHRELAGESVVSIVMTEGGTVSDLLTALDGHPALAGALEGAAVAVNRKYEPHEAVVVVGDEVALISPVAGG
jgi:molybdopterin converting factor small subunit